ncbi:MAG: hypothetical protein ACYS91_07910 [Planctomycetota bacterium]
MNLKTAALITIIGLSVHFILVLFGMLGGSFLYQISPFVGQAFWLLNSIIFNGSLILFLAVFYSKQQS